MNTVLLSCRLQQNGWFLAVGWTDGVYTIVEGHTKAEAIALFWDIAGEAS